MRGIYCGTRILSGRPMLLLAVFMAAGIVLGRFIPMQTVYTLAAVAAAAAALLFRKRLVYFLCAFLFLLGAAMTAYAVDVRYLPTGQAQKVSGHVYNVPYTKENGSTVCLLADAHLDGIPCGNIKLYVPDDTEIVSGDVVFATADTSVPPGVRNPGGFNERLYLLSQNIHYKASAQTVTVLDRRSSIAVGLARLRAYLGDKIDSLFAPDVAPLVRGMLLGDKYGIDENMYMAFKDSGMAHVLAVSGLHAGILIAAVYGLLKLMRIGRTPCLAISLAFILIYACAAGLSPSIVRASIMAATLLVWRYIGRQTDTMSALSLAFIIALLLNPLELFATGFQLSFGAVFGILTIGWSLNRVFKKRLPLPVSNALSASVSATAGTLPLTAAAFNRVSLIGIVSNIIIVPLASLAIVLSFITVTAGLIIGQAAECLGYIAAAVIRLMQWVITGLGVLPFAAADVASPPWFVLIGWYALLFICSKYLLTENKLKAALSAGLSIVVAGALLLLAPSGLYLVFLDVGQGDAAFMRTAQGGEYFFDGGREQTEDEIVSFTIRQGITPEAAFVTHTDSDHFSGIMALYEAGLLHKVYCTWQEQEKVKDAMPKAQVVPLGAGDTVLLDDVTKAVVLYPGKDTVVREPNEASLVLRVEYGESSVLMTGDISGLTETMLFSTEEPVDIYKAAHHGSKYSSYRLPLAVLRPKYSVISVGANSFGHPHAWAVGNLSDYSEQVFTTQDDYAIEFYIEKAITVNTYGGKVNGR